MDILNNYLTYLNEKSKWKEKVISGEIGDNEIKRLKKAGITKTAKQFRSGLRKGTDNIASRYGAKFKRSSGNFSNVGPYQKDDTIYMGKSFESQPKRTMNKLGIKTKKDWDNMKDIIKRHEVDEFRANKKVELKTGTHQAAGSYMGMHGHASPEVLNREKKYLTLYNKLYDKGGVMLNRRKKEYIDAEKYTKPKSLRKMVNKAVTGELNATERTINMIKRLNNPRAEKELFGKVADKLKNIYRNTKNVKHLKRISKLLLSMK